MESVPKKKHRDHGKGRWLLLLALVLALSLLVAAELLLNRKVEVADIPSPDTYEELMVHDADEVARLTVTLRSGESWTAEQYESGTLTLIDESEWRVSDNMAASLLSAAAVVSCDDVLSETPSDYAAELGEYGLTEPKAVVAVDYADGMAVTLRIGDQCPMEEETWYYMTVDGDDRLFAVDRGTVEALCVERALLREVIQPVLHKVRMDRVTFRDESGAVTAQWTLNGLISDSDADAQWQVTMPYTYPADDEAMSTLRDNLANLRLGAYVGEATAENRTLYGFDHPRFVLELHQAAGTTGTASDSGVYDVTDWPESTLVWTLGKAKSDVVDYVMVDGCIYLTSHFTMDTLMSMDVTSTVSRYPVMTALDQLSRLTVANADGTVVYTLRREEQVASNNDLVTDSSGAVVYDLLCERNGVPISYDAFAAAYDILLNVKVSGRLPEDWHAETAAHTTFTFETLSGKTHTVALAPYDALHDAVWVDGEARFYLITDGMTLSVE